MTSNPMELAETNTQTQFVEGPGVMLKEAREKINLTQEDVAARLRLRVSVVKAIEKDNYKGQAGLVFVRGYLRAYANLLNISSDKVIEAFNRLNIKEEVPPERTIWQSRQREVKKERPLRILILIISSCFVILAALWWTAQQKSETKNMTQSLLHTATNYEQPLIKTMRPDVSRLHAVEPKEPQHITDNQKISEEDLNNIDLGGESG